MRRGSFASKLAPTVIGLWERACSRKSSVYTVASANGFVEQVARLVDHFTRADAERPLALGGEVVGGSAMQPDRGRGRVACIGALREQGSDHAAEHVAHAGRGHAGIAAGIDQPGTVGDGDDAAVA